MTFGKRSILKRIFLKKMESMMLFCFSLLWRSVWSLLLVPYRFYPFGVLLLLASVNSNEVLTNLALGELFGPPRLLLEEFFLAAFALIKTLERIREKPCHSLLFSGNISPLLIGGLFLEVLVSSSISSFEFAEETLHILPSGTDVIAGKHCSFSAYREIFFEYPFQQKTIFFKKKRPKQK